MEVKIKTREERYLDSSIPDNYRKEIVGRIGSSQDTSRITIEIGDKSYVSIDIDRRNISVGDAHRGTCGIMTIDGDDLRDLAVLLNEVADLFDKTGKR